MGAAAQQDGNRAFPLMKRCPIHSRIQSDPYTRDAACDRLDIFAGNRVYRLSRTDASRRKWGKRCRSSAVRRYRAALFHAGFDSRHIKVDIVIQQRGVPDC